MRLKPFIVFLVIFTIIYFGGFMIYDHFRNKKDLEDKEKNDYLAINLNNYYKFALFYGVTSSIDINTLISIFEEFKQAFNVQISVMASKYNITSYELVAIEKYLEYIGLLSTKSVNMTLDTINKLSETEETTVVKYSILFSNKYDYKTIVASGGFGAEKELTQINNYYLVPGVRIQDSTIYYVGDLNE